jgi:hypothetical protein
MFNITTTKYTLAAGDTEPADFEHHYRGVGQRLAATALGTGTVVTYDNHWRQWCDFCDRCHRDHYLVDDDQDTVEMLMAYTGYCFEKKNNKLSAINVKLAAISYHHKIKFGVESLCHTTGFQLLRRVLSAVKALTVVMYSNYGYRYVGSC